MRDHRFSAPGQRGQFLRRFHHPFFKGMQWLAMMALILQPAPLSRADGPSNADTDGDGIPDGWETQYGLNPHDSTDAFKDQDGDRVPNLWEYLRGTDPTNPNSAPAPDVVVDGSQATDATQNRYATLQEAYDALPAHQADGVTPYYGFIEVKAGTYTSGVDGTTSPKKVLWQADVGGQVVIQNAGPAMVIADEAVVDGFTIQGDGQTPGPGIVVQPAAGYPEVRVVNTIISGRESDSNSTVGGVLNNGGNLWLVQDTLVANQGASADAVLNAAGSLNLVNSIVGTQASGNPALSVVDQQSGGGLTVQTSIITGMGGAWGSTDLNAQLTDTGGHLTANSSACLGQGTVGAGAVVDLYGQSRPQGSPAPDLGAEQWVDTVGNGIPDWYESQLVAAGLASNFWQLQPGVDYLGDGRSLAQDFHMGVRSQSSGVSYSLTLSADQSSLSPGSTDTLTAQLTATSGGTSHGVNGALVNFNVVSGDGSLSGSNFYTDANGQCSVTFTAGQSSSDVTVSDLTGLGTSQGYSFTVNGSAGDSYSLSVSADNQQLYPSQTANLSAQLQDNVTGPVSGATINFSVVSGDGSLSMVSAITDSMGNATTTFTAGNSNCQVNIWDGNGFGTSSSYNFSVYGTGGTQDSYNLALSADSNVLQPGQTSNFYAYLYDSTTGSPISGALITFGTQFGDGSLGSSSTVTDGNGMATITFTSGYSSTQVNAADSSGYNTSNSFTFGVDTSGSSGGGGGDSPPAPDTYVLHMWADTNPLNPGDQTYLYAQLVDTTQGAVISGASISFSQPYGDGSLGSYSVTTDSNGIAAVSFGGGFNVSQVNACDNNGYGTANSFTFTVTDPGGGGGMPPANPFSLSVWAQNSMVSPGGISYLYAQLTDNTAPLENYTINFGIASGDGTLQQTTGTTDNSGMVTVAFVGGHSQTQVNVTDGDGCNTFTSFTFGVVTINPGDQFSLALWAAPNNPITPGSSSSLYAQLMDRTQGQPVGGATLNFTITSGDGALNTGSATTDANGDCSVIYTGGLSNSVVTAADGNGYGMSQTYEFGATATVNPPPPDTYALTLSADTNPLTANTSTTLQAKVVDFTQGNLPMSGVTLNFFVAAGDGQLGSSSLTTGGDGTCSMTFTGGSSATVINASDASGLNASTTYLVQVASQTGPPPVTYALSLWAHNPSPPPGVTTTFYASLMEQTAPGIDPVPVEGATLVLTRQSGGGILGATSMTTLANGVASTSFQGGTMPTQINVADANGYGTSQSCTLTVGQLYSLSLVGAPATAMNTGDMGALVAVFYDNSTGSPVSGLSVTFTVATGNSTLDNGGISETATTLSDGSCYVGFTMGSSDTEISVADNNGYASSAYTFTHSSDGGTGTGTGTGTGGRGDCGCSQAGCPGSSCSGAGDPGSCTCQSSTAPCTCSNVGNGCACSNAQGCTNGSCANTSCTCGGNNCTTCTGGNSCGGVAGSLFCNQTMCSCGCGKTSSECGCGLTTTYGCGCGCELPCCTCASSGSCKVKIQRDGNDIDPNGQNYQALPGQKISLSLGGSDGISNIQWAPDDHIFKDYTGAAPNSKPDQNNATLTTFKDSDKQASNFDFYWADGGLKAITASFTVNGHQDSVFARINVVQPVGHLEVFPYTPTMTIGNLAGFDGLIHFRGWVDLIPGNLGQGHVTFVQIVREGTQYSGFSDGKSRTITHYHQWVFDNGLNDEYPYADGGQSGAGPVIPTDNPNAGLSSESSNPKMGADATSASSDTSWMMYLMFQPDGGKQVPLLVLPWNWKWSASVGAGGAWRANGALFPQSTDSFNSQATFQHPVWTDKWSLPSITPPLTPNPNAP